MTALDYVDAIRRNLRKYDPVRVAVERDIRETPPYDDEEVFVWMKRARA